MTKSESGSTWTEFFDLSSGGQEKERWGIIYIEAPENEARVIFYNRFGHSPDRISCTCCGSDYSVDEVPESEVGIAKTYRRGSKALVIPASEIADHEREGDVPEEGWVWQ